MGTPDPITRPHCVLYLRGCPEQSAAEQREQMEGLFANSKTTRIVAVVEDTDGECEGLRPALRRVVDIIMSGDAIGIAYSTLAFYREAMDLYWEELAARGHKVYEVVAEPYPRAMRAADGEGY